MTNGWKVPDNIQEEALRLFDLAESEGITLRFFGSSAIRLKCAKYSALLDRADRQPKDIDCVVPRHHMRQLRSLLLSTGWIENAEITAQTDGYRLEFVNSSNKTKLDVCVDVLRFCQTLDVRKRIILDKPTLSATDLLLSKLQIRNLTRFDLIDILVLVYASPLGQDTANAIDIDQIVELTSKSWRWYKSIKTSLLFIQQQEYVSSFDLTDTAGSVIKSRLSLIDKRVLNAPKTLFWHLRSVVGGFMPWHDLVEVAPRW